jgi:opacity protein-like surface antigen
MNGPLTFEADLLITMSPSFSGNPLLFVSFFPKEPLMKKTKSFLFATLALAFAASAAHAQAAPESGVYGEAGYTIGKYTESGNEFQPSAFRLLVGKKINANLAVEGLAAFGVNGGTKNISGSEIKVQADSLVGVYLKPSFQVTPSLEVFGRVGYAKGELTATNTGTGASVKGNGDGASYGVGASYALTPKVSVNADYMMYVSKSNAEYSGVTIGLGYKF